MDRRARRIGGLYPNAWDWDTYATGGSFVWSICIVIRLTEGVVVVALIDPVAGMTPRPVWLRAPLSQPHRAASD